MIPSEPGESRKGIAFGLAAYLAWGFVVFYFKAVAEVPALEVLAHRVVWSVLLLGVILGFRGRWRENLATAYTPRALGILLLTTALIAINWFTFIWAVSRGFVLQASLGYFINPLVNVLLGFLFLRERLRGRQWIAVGLAASGVLLMTLRLGEVPVIALILAFSFGTYGLLRKIVKVDALVGLLVETKLLLPIAIAYLSVLAARGSLVFAHGDRAMDLLLVAGGVVTAVPLLWFANAARRIDYATVGLLQYIAPSLQFLIAVFVYHEPLRAVQLAAFGLIWLGLLVYSIDAWRHRRRSRRKV